MIAENKMNQLHNIGFQLKYKFFVHPQAFALHYPHPSSTPLHDINLEEHKAQTLAIGDEIREQVEIGTYVPVTSFGNLCNSS